MKKPQQQVERTLDAFPGEKQKSGLRLWWPLLVLLAIMAIAYSLGWHKYLSIEKLAENREFYTSYVGKNWIWAILAYAGIYLLTTALSLPVGSILTIIGGFLFGWLVAGFVTVGAATAGATLVFVVAKSTLGEFLRQKAGPFVKKLTEGFNNDAFGYLMFLRLVPVFPFWLVNIAPALFNVKMRTYLITTFLGIIPGTFAIALLGSGLGSVIDRQKAVYDACVAEKGAGSCAFSVDIGALLTPQLLAAFAALGVVALIPVAIKRWKAHTGKQAD
jgi:uncharacterized membrane protein YdjX (TVP38/TMEM64 family)